MSKQELINKLNELEIKAQIYSETDWVQYNLTLDKIWHYNGILLDVMTKEGDLFLQGDRQ